MTKQTKEEGPKLQLKQSFLKAYNFLMFLGCAIGAYVLAFNGNTVSLKVVAAVLAVDAAVHVYKLIAVVK